ncbi:YozQ family protein [Bacillus swezeyi]|nr:YozQ family protein [Bacillus swezeyi]
MNAGEKNRGSHEGHLQGEESRMTKSEGIAVAEEQASDTYMEGTIEDEDR